MNKTATQVLEEQYVKIAAQEIADEIDFEIVSNILIQSGWTVINMRILPQTIGSNVNDWLHTECKKHWQHRGNTWIFEDRNEAALFKLTWS
jgi:hypothetical protein